MRWLLALVPRVHARRHSDFALRGTNNCAGGIMRAATIAVFGFVVASSPVVAQVVPGDPCPAPQSATGRFQEIRFPDALRTMPSAINARGDIVGHYYLRDFRSHGFLYRAGRFTTVDGPDGGNTYLTDISEAGVIVGMSGKEQFYSGDTGQTGFTYDNGIFTRLELPNAVATRSLSINTIGDVVGTFQTAADDTEGVHSFLWRNGIVQLLDGFVRDINAAGDLLIFLEWSRQSIGSGTTFDAVHECNGYVSRLTDEGWLVGATYDPDGSWSDPFVNTGTALTVYKYPGASNTSLTDINSSGIAVGVAYLPGLPHSRGFIHRPAQPLRIETPNSPARWGVGTTQRLAWTYAANATQFLIEISRDSGESWEYLSTVPNRPGNSQNFRWKVTGPVAGAARFRVTAIGDEQATDVNDADIRIAKATLEILAPTQTTTASFGSTLGIRYKHSLGARAPVVIEVSSDNGNAWRTAAETSTTGSTDASFWWTVDLLPTARARIRVRALDGSGATAMSRAFTVTARLETTLQFQDLGSLVPGGWTGARAINNRGHVVGFAALDPADVPSSRSAPFLWTPERGLQPLLLDVVPDLFIGSAVDINDGDEVIGEYHTFHGGGAHGFLWSAQGGFIDLGTEFSPMAINNRGQIVGACRGIEGEEFFEAIACLWESGFIRSLDILIGYWGDGIHRLDINQRGEVSGNRSTGRVGGEAWLWTPEKGVHELPLIQSARAMNSLGQIVGTTSDGTVVLSRRGAILRTASGDLQPQAINSRGWVLGRDTSDDGYPVLWQPNGEITRLSSKTSFALDINNRGEIAGSILMSDGLHPVVWTVRATDAPR